MKGVTKTEVGAYFDDGLLDPAAAAARFQAVRGRTLDLAEPISPEDAQVQSMPDVSPTKWHLAHTSWLFETFILKPYSGDYRVFDERFHFLFNSYYEAEGPRQPRPERGLITRPGLAEVKAYRQHVDEATLKLLKDASGGNSWTRIVALLDMGCHHEEQHQELLLTDIKHVLAANPYSPAYREPAVNIPDAGTNKGNGRGEGKGNGWTDFSGGLCEVGFEGNGFAFDCEGPRHKVWLEDYSLGSKLVTNADYLAFLEDGGYGRSELWLSDGWARINEEGWRQPLYWRKSAAGWSEFTLSGEQPLDPELPVSHLSFYEADAFAAWAGARLPLEEELELAAVGARDANPNDPASGRLHPAESQGDGIRQLFGELWEWTRSAYSPYPGFKAAAGAVGEYNGKFMCNQFVLKGGSCVTPPGHCRASYRNFFPPEARWQFSGLRLARDAS